MAPLCYAAKFDLDLDPPWHNPRKGRDQILPSGNTALLQKSQVPVVVVRPPALLPELDEKQVGRVSCGNVLRNKSLKDQYLLSL